ncbi:hypothetical protein [Gracilibacillus dipsosauri]|uniref:hypothetical protein n=1 Tax=Gracilibacillus dipsosauri TaxID=178340 RepID=UPI0024092134
MKRIISFTFICILCLLTTPVLTSANVKILDTGSHENAKTTAYSLPQRDSNGGLTRTHSGKIPAWGMVAMQYRALPFGTSIYTNTPISHPVYGSRSSFKVEDSGPGVYGTQLDIWYGFCQSCDRGGSYDNYDLAINYGVKYIDYTFITP